MEKVLALLLFRARVKGGKWAWKKKKKRKRIGWAYTHARARRDKYWYTELCSPRNEWKAHLFFCAMPCLGVRTVVAIVM